MHEEHFKAFKSSKGLFIINGQSLVTKSVDKRLITLTSNWARLDIFINTIIQAHIYHKPQHNWPKYKSIQRSPNMSWWVKSWYKTKPKSDRWFTVWTWREGLEHSWNKLETRLNGMGRITLGLIEWNCLLTWIFMDGLAWIRITCVQFSLCYACDVCGYHRCKPSRDYNSSTRGT